MQALLISPVTCITRLLADFFQLTTKTRLVYTKLPLKSRSFFRLAETSSKLRKRLSVGLVRQTEVTSWVEDVAVREFFQYPHHHTLPPQLHRH